ncbi:MAG: hypothetical protein RIE24_07960 [Silicimonas sp.]|jgi:hypothetical protein|uniref:hypothetical protein n=1 Tax=Roseitalea porphyridii TaxID=1852022 RepID=UPI0032EFF87F
MFVVLENLDEALKSTGISKSLLADKAGLSPSTVDRAVRARRIRRETSRKIISAVKSQASIEEASDIVVVESPEPSQSAKMPATIESDDVREVYVQSSWNMRAFMLLRFRHFATFSVILAFIATGAFRVDEVSDFRGYILIFGVLITIAFWILDFRTGEYLSFHARRMSMLESKMLKRFDDVKLPEHPQPRLLSASTVTNIIFLLILFGWLSFSVIQIAQRNEPQTTDPALPQSSTENPPDRASDTPP